MGIFSPNAELVFTAAQLMAWRPASWAITLDQSEVNVYWSFNSSKMHSALHQLCTGAATVHIPEHSLSINKAEGICLTLAKMVWQYGSLKRQTSLAKTTSAQTNFLFTQEAGQVTFTIWNTGWSRLDFYFAYFYKLAFQIKKWFTSNQKSCVAQSTSPPDVWGLAWSLVGGTDNDWEPFWQSLPCCARGHFCRDEGFWTWQKGSVWSQEPAELPRLLLLDCWEGKSCIFSKNGKKHLFQACGSTYSPLLAVCFSPQSQSSSVWSCQRLWPLWHLVCHSCLLTV